MEDTHIFAPTLVNSARVGFYKEKYTDGDPLYGVTPFKGDEAVKQIGLQGVNPKGYSAEGFPRMDISGYPSLFTQPGGERQNDHDWGYADTATWSKGRHVIKLGGEYKPQSRFSGFIPEGTYGSFAFNGSLSGYAYADFLLGLPFTSTRLDPLTNRTLTGQRIRAVRAGFIQGEQPPDARSRIAVGSLRIAALRRRADVELGSCQRERSHSCGQGIRSQPAVPDEYHHRQG